jgi:hypothetical protein
LSNTSTTDGREKGKGTALPSPLKYRQMTVEEGEGTHHLINNATTNEKRRQLRQK